jgi:simple sugar transport system ATP-binding protein
MSVGSDILRAENIAKHFGAVTALVDVSLRLGRGEVLGLIGDNGAGKSTLVKILAGFQQPDAGRLLVNGDPITLRSVAHARSLGIETVYQDLALVKELSVYENMFLGRELVWSLLNAVQVLRRRRMRAMAGEYLERMGLHLSSLDDAVAHLSGGQRQAIAVARSAYSDAKVLLLDEPLAAMGAREGAVILGLVRELKSRGDVSIIIIAHNYSHIVEVCDRVNLLQHGRIALDKPTGETSVEELTRLVAAEYRMSSGGSGA